MAELGANFEIVSLDSGADLSSSEYLAVKQNSSGQVVLAGAGDQCLGFVTAAGNHTLPSAAGGNVGVAYDGLCEAVAGAAITTPTEVEINAAGKVITLASGIAVGWCTMVAATNDIVIVKKY